MMNLTERLQFCEQELGEQKEIVEHMSFENHRIQQEQADLENLHH